MLKPSWVPSPLVEPEDRPAVPIVPVERPSPWRTWHVFAELAGLALALAGLIVIRRFDRHAYARRVRLAVERLGGLWVKAGQLFSLRIDVFPVEICRELARLQSQALGFSGDLARQIVERELGVPIDVRFDRWDTTPLAAASIGQVHRARLRREQVWVAVKVQKPMSRELFDRDLGTIRWLVAALKLLRVHRHMNWDIGLHELREIMKEELDFGYEASSTRRMRRNLRKHGIYVPRVFARYSTPHVLVTELVPAVFMADYIRSAREQPERLKRWLVVNRVNPRRVARRLVVSLERQMLEDNLFHGDMHPGNIGLLRGGRIVLIDFGTTNFTEASYLHKFDLFTRALGAQEHSKAADMCLSLCARLPPVDTSAVRERLVRVFRSWHSRTLVRQLPYHDRSLDGLTLEVMRGLLGFGCTMEWAWLRLHRAISTLDASLIELHPDLDHGALLGRYLMEAERRRIQSVASSRTARRTLGAAARASDIQERVSDYAMFQTQLMRRHAQAFRGAADKAASVAAAALGLAMIAVAAQAAAAAALLLRSWSVRWPADLVGPQLAAVVDRLPAIDLQSGALILLVDLWIWHALRRVRRELTRRDVNIARRAAATA